MSNCHNWFIYTFDELTYLLVTSSRSTVIIISLSLLRMRRSTQAVSVTLQHITVQLRIMQANYNTLLSFKLTIPTTCQVIVPYYNLESSCVFFFRTTSPYFDHREKTHAVWTPDQKGWVSRRQENSDCSSPEWLEKASWTTPLLLDGHHEERPISAQPHLWGCYRNGPG